MYMTCGVDPTDFGRECEDADDFAAMLNGAGAAMSKDKEDVQAWMLDTVNELDKKGREFVEALIEAYKKEE